MTSDKRRAKRISVELPVSVYLFDTKNNTRTTGAIEGMVKNFSPYGAALAVSSILLDNRHMFYTCHDNPDLALQLVFAPDDRPENRVTVPAAPVWFDRDRETEKKQFVVGLKFLVDPKSSEIKRLCKKGCGEEKMLVTLWKKLF
jgi:hypothetical protein